jgi:hypothetical protein
MTDKIFINIYRFVNEEVFYNFVSKLKPMKRDTVPLKERIEKKYSQRKYHLPVIGHFSDRSVRFNSILEASRATQIHPSLIFEACIGKIFKAKNTHWEYEKGNHYLKYKAFYIRTQASYTRRIGFNG